MPITDNYTVPSSLVNNDSVELVDSTSSNINLRAAAIHVIGDFIQSLGVLIASLVIWFWVSHLVFNIITENWIF